MALNQLNDEQIATWTRLEKDTWWLENVYRGEMPQLTVRAAITGFLLGGILSATALYIAGKTGISIGVGLTSVILAFAIYKILSRTGLIGDFTRVISERTMHAVPRTFAPQRYVAGLFMCGVGYNRFPCLRSGGVDRMLSL